MEPDNEQASWKPHSTNEGTEAEMSVCLAWESSLSPPMVTEWQTQVHSSISHSCWPGAQFWCHVESLASPCPELWTTVDHTNSSDTELSYLDVKISVLFLSMCLMGWEGAHVSAEPPEARSVSVPLDLEFQGS